MLEGEHAQEDFPRGAIVRRHPFLTRTHLRLRVSPIVHAIRHHRPCRQHDCARQRMPPSDSPLFLSRKNLNLYFPSAAISVIWTAPLTGIRVQYLDYLALKTQFFNTFLTGVIQFNPV